MWRRETGFEGEDIANACIFKGCFIVLSNAGTSDANGPINYSYPLTLLHLPFLCCILECIETTMSFADPNQALTRGNAVSTELIPIPGVVLIIGVGVAGPA